jgi:hypothetical protein
MWHTIHATGLLHPFGDNLYKHCLLLIAETGVLSTLWCQVSGKTYSKYGMMLQILAERDVRIVNEHGFPVRCVEKLCSLPQISSDLLTCLM